MLNFLSTLTQDLHLLIVQFPIALFPLSFLFALLARFWPKLRETERLLLVIGTLAAFVAVITGLIAYLPYEDTLLTAVIEPHQFSALIGTIAMIAIIVWQAISRRKGKDLGQTPFYLVFALLGLA